MNVYKIGNEITGVIRAVCPGQIGSTQIEYAGQPYTVVKDVDVELSFDNVDSTYTSRFTQLAYNNSKLSEIRISDVSINDKILNLIFLKSETKLVSKLENCQPEERKIYINSSTDRIYNIFIYNNAGELENYIEELDGAEIDVQTDNNYLVCYQYEATLGYSLDKPASQYYCLDLISLGNEDDNIRTINIHAEKCALKIDKNMTFSQNSNTVDLIFTVIDTGENYITIN